MLGKHLFQSELMRQIRAIAPLAAWLALTCYSMPAMAKDAPFAINIGSRRELFLDSYLVDSMSGVTRKLHSPQPRDVALKFDSPWDGACSIYVTAFQDGDKFRMYYRGLPVAKPLIGLTEKEYWDWVLNASIGKSVTCYAESSDGIHWTKPNLGLVKSDVTGSTENNIVLTATEKWPDATHNFVVFKDSRPGCAADAKYKAIGRHFLPDDKNAGGHTGNLAFQSPDGIHWKLMQDEVIFEEYGHAFDSQNIIFWDPVREVFVEYHRKFRNGYRDVRTSTSKDFLHWTEPQFLEYGGAPPEHFNHLLVTPYFRAPHLYVGIADRITETRDDFRNHPASGISDVVFLSSRDGVNFDRSFMEAWIRPGLDVKNWMHCGTSPAWALLQTGPEELSVYWIQNYYQPDATCYLQRGTLRLDGFVSMQAPYAGGEFVTKPLKFEGSELAINFSTSITGLVRVEIQDANGQAIEGFRLEDCPEIYGDRIEQVVAWKGGADVSSLAGKAIRLRFVMKDADLYAFQFRSPKSP